MFKKVKDKLSQFLSVPKEFDNQQRAVDAISNFMGVSS